MKPPFVRAAKYSELKKKAKELKQDIEKLWKIMENNPIYAPLQRETKEINDKIRLNQRRNNKRQRKRGRQRGKNKF